MAFLASLDLPPDAFDSLRKLRSCPDRSTRNVQGRGRGSGRHVASARLPGLRARQPAALQVGGDPVVEAGVAEERVGVRGAARQRDQPRPAGRACAPRGCRCTAWRRRSVSSMSSARGPPLPASIVTGVCAAAGQYRHGALNQAFAHVSNGALLVHPRVVVRPLLPRRRPLRRRCTAPRCTPANSLSLCAPGRRRARMAL